MDMLAEIWGSCDIVPSQNKSLIDWKLQGKKALGYICTNIPEEIIYAAGILPVRLLGSSIEISEAYSCYSPYMCYFTRSFLELGLKGGYANLDGIAMAFGCDAGNDCFHILAKYANFPYAYSLYHPLNTTTEAAYIFYLKEVSVFKESLEKFAGVEITPQDLRQAVKVYNENRALLRQVYDLRGKEDPPLLSGTEVEQIVISSMLMPKEKHNELLTRVLKEVPRRRGLSPGGGPRLHISGSIVPDLEIFKVIEELGGRVVSDDLCIGSRYFWDGVDESLEPLEALTQRYLDKKVPCPGMASENTVERELDHILQMKERYEFDGVIFCIQRFCDPHQIDQPFLMEGLRQSGVPSLTFDVEQTVAPPAELRARLRAFFEVMRR